MNDPKQSPHAKDFMTHYVEVVTPDMTLTQVIRFLVKHKLSNAPVVEIKNDKKFLLGFISEGDCLSAVSNELFFGNPSPPQSAKTIMSAHPICIAPETELFSIVSIFTSHNIHHLPVVENGELQGIVSRSDILKEMETYYNQIVHTSEHERQLRDTSQIMNLRFTIDRT
ncbi:CBS domain-containing protein [uncultured Gimesia sp.]|uniref:CBS domain-containing protein n=1 Tax=uncultured Gimesia sp. TaxID=1678688 RepID=UPI0030D7ED6B|tara:strand:+ start:116790 stop:117296 length:507 start_codon:yes stop_codon:yes gene_type:complete